MTTLAQDWVAAREEAIRNNDPVITDGIVAWLMAHSVVTFLDGSAACIDPADHTFPGKMIACATVEEACQIREPYTIKARS